jgi:hypothetical protein
VLHRRERILPGCAVVPMGASCVCGSGWAWTGSSRRLSVILQAEASRLVIEDFRVDLDVREA